MTTITLPAPRWTSADAEHVHNKPFAVDQHNTGTLAPHVAAMRAIHVREWLRESDLETVVNAWQAVRAEGVRG